MDQNYYENIYRKESFILTPASNFGSGMKFLDFNNRKDIDRELVRLQGSEKEPGKYYLPGHNEWAISVIPALKMILDDLEQKFAAYSQKRVNEGFQRPQDWPDDLAEERAKTQARLKVAQEEVAFLKEAREKAPVPREEVEPVKHRKHWGSGRLRNGILVEIGGFRVTPEKDGILRIDDPRSDHDGMEVWRFKSHICKPMSWEYSHLEREEVKAARKEGRSARMIPYPKAGIWNRETDEIEYPGYSDITLGMIKELQSQT